MHPLPEEQAPQQGVDMGQLMQMLTLVPAAAPAPAPAQAPEPAAPVGPQVKVSEALEDYLERNAELSRDSVGQARQAVSLFTFSTSARKRRGSVQSCK